MNRNRENRIKEDELYDYKELVGEEKKPLIYLSVMLKKQLNCEKEKLQKVYKWE